MKIPIPITAAGLMLAAAAALGGCAADPAPAHEAMPTSTTTPALTAGAAAMIEALPPGTSRDAATRAASQGKPFYFTAHTPEGEECWKWLLLPNGDMWAIGDTSDGEEYVKRYSQRGEVPGINLATRPRSEWVQALACNAPKPTWVSVPPTPASAIPRGGSGLQPGDPVPTTNPTA